MMQGLLPLLVLTFFLSCQEAVNGDVKVTAASNAWQRSALLYLPKNRTDKQFRHYVQRMDYNGRFVNQQMFDSIIFLSQLAEEAGGSEQGLTDNLNVMFTAAEKMDKVMTSCDLSPKKQLQFIFALPYFSNDDKTIELSKKNYRLSVPSERTEAAMWFVRKVKSFAESANWNSSTLYGIYFMKEGADDWNADPQFMKSVNEATQRQLQLGTVWVPGYSSAISSNSWKGREFGFNVTVVQPSYSFLSSIDGGDMTGARLYDAGQRLAKVGQSFEYELRPWPATVPLAYHIAHQYLAVSQVTGVDKFPQVFFMSYFLDEYSTLRENGFVPWSIYRDLADYLGGSKIKNFELEIPWTPARQVNQNIFQLKWTVPSNFDNLNSIRLDFQDTKNSIWRGRLSITTPKKEEILMPKIVSYGQRMGVDTEQPGYDSIFVPLGNLNTSKGTELTIELTREDPVNTEWPMVWRLVAAKLESPAIANPLYGQISTSSRPQFENRYKDTAPTHKGFAKGQLTDGNFAEGKWWEGQGVTGWSTQIFSITIDLGQIQKFSEVKLVIHYYPRAGVNVPSKLHAVVGRNCEPQIRGVVGLSCVPTASTGVTKIIERGTYGRIVSLFFSSKEVKGQVQQVDGRYVTISGVPVGCVLLYEVQILDQSGAVLSTGAPYRVTPIPGNTWDESQPRYGDNFARLLDNNVMTDFVFGMHGASEFDGLLEVTKGQGGWVEATWGQARKGATNAVVWFTLGADFYPEWVSMQWRNEKFVWQPPVNVSNKNSHEFSKKCGVASGVPCSKLKLPVGAMVTGVKSTFPPRGWFMVTEISIE